MPREQKIFQVTFYEYLQVVERVVATSKTDAIRRVKEGEGERDMEMVDEERWPFGFKAKIEGES